MITAPTGAHWAQVINLLADGPRPWFDVVDVLTTGPKGQQDGRSIVITDPKGQRRSKRVLVPNELFVHRRKLGTTEEGADDLIRQMLLDGVIQVIPRGKSRRKPGLIFLRLTPPTSRPRKVNDDDLTLLRHLPRPVKR
jgi:hypothetical protein